MQLDNAYGIELDSFTDLVRLVSSSSPDRPSTIFKWFSEDKSHVFYGSFAIFPGYYNLKALPVLFFILHDSSIEEHNHSLVRYDLQAKESQVSFLSHIKERDLENVHTGLIRFIPIVKLKKAPKIFSDLI
ncbi:MAG: hypothetical protein ACXADY_18075 [Candidatus Hodarchaeales archaeon]|jgi:hypothetical protein